MYRFLFTEIIAKEFLYLPIGPELNDNQLQYCRLVYSTVLSDVLTSRRVFGSVRSFRRAIRLQATSVTSMCTTVES